MPQTTPKIACCMICKGDAELSELKVAINSVKPFVDDVYLTTSAEHTETERWCKKRGIHFSHRDWTDDFASQRNFNFNQIKGDYDFIFWMDVDDELVGGQYLSEVASKAIKDNVGTVFFDYWYSCEFNGEPSFKNVSQVHLVQPRERLLKVGTHTWKNRLHETPVPIGEMPKYVRYRYEPPKQNILIVHRDTQLNFVSSEKMQRNRKLLELQLSDELARGEADPRTLLNLIKIYVEIDDKDLHDKAIEMSKEYLEKSGWDEERGICHERIAMIYLKRGETERAIQHLIASIGEYPMNLETKLILAEAYFGINQYEKAKHWLDVAMQMDIKHPGSSVVAVTPIKIRAAKLMLKWAFHVEKNIKKAVEASKMLLDVDPSQENIENHEYLLDLKDMDDACGHINSLCDYLDSIGEHQKIISIIDKLPTSIRQQPFAIKLRQKYSPPRKWGEKEICYFATFGSAHFEKWDGNSLESGIGGSETAVIRLAEEWTKKGYSVTVYCDPFEPCLVNGVKYLPYYWFNQDDEFNIFIQWRANFMAGKVKAKKFLIDLHDIFNPADYTPEKLKSIDRVMVKSQFHKELAPNIPDSQFNIVSNGI